jgi:hypothetical protein
MSRNDHPLTENEERVLRFLGKWNVQRFSLEELGEGVGVAPEIAEKTLLSLKERGLIDTKLAVTDNEAGKQSLEATLSNVRELLDRLLKLAARRESTKATVFDRVRERLNEELSKAIASLEFAADRTHDILLRLATEIEEFRDRIDETTVSHDIGEISGEEAEKRVEEFRIRIVGLEAQRKEVFKARFEGLGIDVSSEQRLKDESQRLGGLLEELDVRREVGEFDGRDGEFNAERNRILLGLASLSGKQTQEDVLVAQARNAAQTGKALVDDKTLTEEIFSRLNRACERIVEMSSSANYGK